MVVVTPSCRLKLCHARCDVSLSLQSALLNVTIGRHDPREVKENTLPTDVLMMTTGTLSQLNASLDTVDIVLKQWRENPHAWVPDGRSVAGDVLTIEVVSNGSVVPLRKAPQPVLFLVPISTLLDWPEITVANVGCAFWNPDALVWEHNGTAAVDFQWNATAGRGFVVCSAVHLTSFSVTKARLWHVFGNVNIPNPLRDFSHVSGAFTPKSLYVTVATIVIVVGTLVGALAARLVDKRYSEQLADLRALHLILLGRVAHGKGLDSVDANHATRKRMRIVGLLLVRDDTLKDGLH